MSMHEVAKHLSAMGRKGDTTLVHMSPQEVSALHGIAALHGTHLTHNPHTGLPEAFSLGGFFKSLLPTIVGAVAAPLTGGGSLIPVLAGAATGAALNSGNPLMGALTGGLGGYGGFNIGDALKSAGTAASTAPAAASGSEFMPNIAGVAQEVTPVGVTNYYGGASAAPAAASEGISSLGKGISSLGTEAGRDAFVKSLGGTGPNADLIAAGKVGLPVGLAALSGIEPPKMPGEEKYDPNFKLDLSGDSGLRFFAEGGDINETPDPDSDPLQDAREARNYGIGGLSYAQGGGVFGGQGLNLGTSSGANFNNSAGYYSPAQFEQMYNAYNQNRFPMGNAFLGRAKQPELSPEQIQFNKMMQASRPAVNPGLQYFANAQYQKNLSPEQQAFNQQLQDYNKAQMDYYKQQNPKGFLGMFGNNYGGLPVGSTRPLNIWQGNTSMSSGAGPFGGNSQALFAKGGYLDGPGDGMSDSIPATIGGKQPARLADGEFVVPADVVSHIGNGSTKAGAQRLYDMMAKVRKARTGTTKQGKQINPNKYMPA